MEAPLHAAVCSLLAHASVEIDFYFILNGFNAKHRDLLLQSMDLSGKAYKATFLDEPSPEELSRLGRFTETVLRITACSCRIECRQIDCYISIRTP